ncbi:ATP-binding protein [Mesorhizobium xinjiangense]|uniref:ATP-binding protein n=1 Tax=Mesorhizobium xinjiangense TaxID=2678685 RepID=UPI0012ED48B4|nr:ATP-binding protein [Mesorhizobium xinjiangense]
MNTNFVEISAVRIIHTAIDRAMAWQYPSRVISCPGMGKTTALRHFERELGAVYCLVKAQHKDTAGMYLMLLEAYGLRRHGKTARDDANQVYRELARTEFVQDTFQLVQHERPLLVDEYQTLEATALRELLNIVEECRIPLVLCGNGERLAKERKADRAALEQVWNRVRPTYRVDPPDADDCRSIAIEFDVEFDRATYAALAAYGSRSSLRDLVCLLGEARAVAGAGVLKLHHIETAVLTIHDSRDALKRLAPAHA